MASSTGQRPGDVTLTDIAHRSYPVERGREPSHRTRGTREARVQVPAAPVPPSELLNEVFQASTFFLLQSSCGDEMTWCIHVPNTVPVTRNRACHT